MHRRRAPFHAPEPETGLGGMCGGSGRVECRTIHIPDVLADPGVHLRLEQTVGHERFCRTDTKDDDYRRYYHLPEGVRPFHRKPDRSRAEPSQTKPSSPSKMSGCSTKCRRRNCELRQQTATADVLKVISRSTFDVKPCSTHWSSRSSAVCEADMAVIPLITADGVFEHVASYNFPVKLIIPLGRRGSPKPLVRNDDRFKYRTF